ETELKFSHGTVPDQKFDQTKVWADPIIGARLRGRIWEKWFAVVFGDVGGFGLASHLTWQAFGGVVYEFSDRRVRKVGCRARRADYEEGGFKFDVVQHGPIIGLGIRF